MAKAKGTGRKRLAMVKPDFTLRKGETPEDSARVVYIPGKGLLPHIPYDPDLPSPILANGWSVRDGKLANGLTPRADAFARLVARGVTASDAMRSTWPRASLRSTVTRASRLLAMCKAQISQHRVTWENAQQQKTMPMRDFVLSRLTIEAQEAPESSSRIKALDLLGKSEAMWTTVQRQEHTVSPAQLAGLKTQLEQRLSTVLSKLGVRSNAMPSGGGNRIIDNYGKSPDALGIGAGQPLDPHPGGHPPLLARDPRLSGDTNPLTQIPTFPGSILVDGTRSGTFVREVTAGDLGLDEEHIAPDLPDYLRKNR